MNMRDDIKFRTAVDNDGVLDKNQYHIMTYLMRLD
jgi:hypothetical protein